MSEFRLIVPDSTIRLPVTASDNDILDLVRLWIDALAAEDYERAYGMTAHSSFSGFTPDIIRRVIEGYGTIEPDPNNPDELEEHRNFYREQLRRIEEAGPSSFTDQIEHPHEAERAWRQVVANCRQALEDVGKPKPKNKITDWRTARIVDIEPRHDVNREIDEVWFDLPLNGGWSDLTAIFDIRELDSAIVLQLEQIHVT